MEEEKKEDKIVFSSFTDSVNQKELNAILYLCEKSYNKVAELQKSREELMKGIGNSIIDGPERDREKINKLEKEITKKLIDKLDERFIEQIPEEVANVNNIVSFLNIFRDSSNELQEIDKKLVNKAKKYVRENL